MHEKYSIYLDVCTEISYTECVADIGKRSTNMVVKAQNRPMEVIEQLREEAGLSKTEMSKRFSSRTKYYEHLEAVDIKVGAFLTYLDILGYEVIIAKKGIKL